MFRFIINIQLYLPMQLKALNKWRLKFFILGIISAILVTLPVHAAEQIFMYYGIWGTSVSVKSLKAFAEEGKVEKDLEFLVNRLSDKQKTGLKKFLQTRYDVNPITFYRLAQTYAGNQVLTFLGKGLQIPTTINGIYGLKGSIVESLITNQDISVIDLLDNFPTDINLDISHILKSTKQVFSLIKDNQAFIKYLNQISSVKSSSPTPSFLDLRKPGDFSVVQDTLNLHDVKRDRSLAVSLYLPKTQQGNIGVIFISNGLGAHIERFTKLANHLASHGFAVVIPDHPNSNDTRQKEFYQGLHKEPFDATEFVDRPLDITYVLDELEQLNLTKFNNNLNLKEVGIFGYSFGGTTSLALGGARLNFEELKRNCYPPNGLINISLLYQCRALELPEKNYDLKDNRIKAAFLFVPFAKSLYGKSEISRIDIPVFWHSTEEDVITPLLTEQIPAFNWLTTSNKYLVVSEKLPHTRILVNALGKLTNQGTSPERLIEITQEYLNALNLAFFQVYIAQNEEFRPYLQASYAKVLNEEPYHLNLVNSLNISDYSQFKVTN